MAAANKRQTAPGYPTGQNQKEEAPPVDNSIKTQEADGEDVDETDRGISARFRFGYPKPRTHEPYPGPGLVPFNDYDPTPPRGRYNHPSGYDYPPPHGHARPGFQPHVSYEVSVDEEDEVDYEGGYGHQAIRRPQQYNERQTYVDEEEVDYEGGYGHQAIPRPQRYYERQTYVAEQPPPPPPPPRRPVYPPQGNYYVRDEYERY